jgi:DNA-binding CsgD family transcriptional regulator
MSESENRIISAEEKAERRTAMQHRIQQLKGAGYSNEEIAQQLNLSESTVRILVLDKKLNG